MIHTTIGVYSNGSYKTNGVKCEDLANHIFYNMSARPGRALIVDNVVICKGQVRDSILDNIKKLNLKETRYSEKYN